MTAAGDTQKDVWARRLALQITAQLPECEAEALEVLKYARELVTFVSRGRQLQAPSLTVVSTQSHTREPA